VRLRLRDRDRGVALPSWAVGASIGAVVVAMLALVVSGSPDRGDEAAADPVAESSAPSEPTRQSSARPQPSTPTQTQQAPASTKPPDSEPRKPKPRNPVPDRDAYVEVYNNSGITGLANETAAMLQDTGWEVVGADNWYGSIPENTVYYPERLHDDARVLASDLGIGRLHTAVAPMRFDRLTVILTGPL
jgi:LytR cell envelope-related transcriptional attenuator